MWKRNWILLARRWSSSSSEEFFNNDLLRKRLLPYLEKTSYVDRNSLKYRKASVLLPLYCNKKTNQVEILVLKRSEKVRSYTGMIVFAGGMADSTDQNAIQTAEREAEEEIGLKREFYSILGCLPPVADARGIVITPVVALLHSKFDDFRLLLDEASEAFYLELKQFLYAKNNYQMLEIDDDFVTHHFDIDQYHIWGVTAFELITIAALVYRQVPEFPFFRHGEQLDLQLFTEQLQKHFRLIVDYANKHQILDDIDHSK